MTQTHPAHHTHAQRPTPELPSWWNPCGTNPHRVNLAYLYDAFREARSDGRFVPSGKDAHLNERDAAQKLVQRVPQARFVFRSERAFLDRVTTYLVKYPRVSTIVVAGAGLPSLTGDDLHCHVRRCEANNRAATASGTHASVIYVERDPLTCAVLRTIADRDNGVYVVNADPWNPTAMWDALDDERGEGTGLVFRDDDHVALVLAGVMSFHGGTRAEAAQLVQEHLARLPAGAFLAMTHLHDPEHPEMTPQAREFEHLLQLHGPGTGSLATGDEIAAMITGTDVFPPGIVPAFQWYPEGPPLDPPVCGHFNAAVLTRKPVPDSGLPEPPWHAASTR
jgi:hypothetical protein